MKTWRAGWVRLSFVAVAALVLAGLAATEAGVAQGTPKIDDLAWMTGSWQTSGGRMQSEEHWTKPAAGTMFATSRTIAGERTVFFEFLRIETRADGIYYVSRPKGAQSETAFKLTSLEGEKAVFENPQHDHPQKISYWKNADGTMTARIEGDREGKKGPMDFVFKGMGR